MPKIEKEHTDIVWARVDAVAVLILENERYLQSKRNKELSEIVSKKFDCDERTAQRYIAEAKREIRKVGTKNRENAFIKAIRDREFLITKAKGVKDDKGKFVINPDYKLLLEILKDIAKLNGLYIDEIKHSGEIAIRGVDFSKLPEHALQRIASGEDPAKVLSEMNVITSKS